jgi:hypothetical protein
MTPDLAPIIATLVPDEHRLDFLPRHLGTPLCIKVEGLIFWTLDKASPDYAGGFWEFYDLTNGGFYIAPQTKNWFRMRWDDNGFEGNMSAPAAGIAVTLMALGTMSFAESSQHHVQRLSRKFHLLRDFAMEHAEANGIIGFVD